MVIPSVEMDVMLSAYLLNYNIKDYIAYVANDLGYMIEFDNKKDKLDGEEIAKRSINKAKFIYEVTPTLVTKMTDEGVIELFNNIEEGYYCLIDQQKSSNKSSMNIEMIIYDLKTNQLYYMILNT